VLIHKLRCRVCTAFNFKQAAQKQVTPAFISTPAFEFRLTVPIP